MKKVLLVILCLTTACGPAPRDIALTMVAQTAAAMPTSTVTPANTPTPTPTVTPAATPTATPDLRVIDTYPSKLLCIYSEMPKEGNYILPSGWMSPNTNEEVIGARNVEDGTEYVNKTGRVLGWWVQFWRSRRAAVLPETIECGVYTFKTAEGAKLAVSKYNSVPWKQQRAETGEQYISIDRSIGLGDLEQYQVYHRIKAGVVRETTFSIFVTYHNLMLNISGWSRTESDVRWEDLEPIMRTLFAKVAAAPLVDPASADWPK